MVIPARISALRFLWEGFVAFSGGLLHLLELLAELLLHLGIGGDRAGERLHLPLVPDLVVDPSGRDVRADHGLAEVLVGRELLDDRRRDRDRRLDPSGVWHGLAPFTS